MTGQDGDVFVEAEQLCANPFDELLHTPPGEICPADATLEKDITAEREPTLAVHETKAVG